MQRVIRTSRKVDAQRWWGLEKFLRLPYQRTEQTDAEVALARRKLWGRSRPRNYPEQYRRALTDFGRWDEAEMTLNETLVVICCRGNAPAE